MKLRKLFSLVLSTSILLSVVPVWVGTAHAESFPVATALETAPTLSGNTLVMPETDDGSVISIFGSDNKQVVDIDGNVYKPLVDMTVNLILKATAADGTVTNGTKNVSVTVPGTYTATDSDNAMPKTLPTIREWKGNTGDFTLSSSSKIVYADESLEGKATQVKTFFNNMLGYDLSVVAGTSASTGDVLLLLDETKLSELGDEGYYVEIADSVTITAPTEVGILYGGTTMTQILSQADGKNTAPKGLIRDYPAYEVRSIMMDLGRPYYPLEFIESIGMYMSYYKMNEFHAHLNEGSFRVEVEAYDFLKAAKPWSKADYIAMEDRLLDYGVSVLNEIDTPGHSASFAGNDQDIPMIDASHLDIVSEENRAKAEVGIQRLYDEFIDGEWTNKDGSQGVSSCGPIVKNNELHIGFDEYLHTSGQDSAIWAGYKQYTIDMLNYVTNKGTQARQWIFLGDSTNPDEFPAYTEEELAQIEHPELITANIWIEQWGDAKLALDYGFNIVNSENVQLYFVPGVKGYWQNFPLANRFDNWEVTTYYASNENILKGHPQNRGASACLWFDKAGQETGFSYEDIFAQVKDMVMLISEKTWHGDKADGQTGEEFEERVDIFGEFAPTANPGGRVASAGKKVAEYKFDTDGSDTSGNGYNATLTNVTAIDGKVAFDGTSGAYISLPFEKIGFPYTVTFDLTLSEYPASGTTMNLFASEDGTEKMYIDSTGEIWYEGKGPCTDNTEKYRIYGYNVPLNEKVNLTLVCEEAENITTTNAKIPVRYDLSLIVNDSDEYTASHTTATECHSTRQSIQTAKIGEGLKGTIDNLIIYNVNALQESLSETDALSAYAQNMIEGAYELEDTTTFSTAGVTNYGGTVDSAVYHSGSGSLKFTGKKRYNETAVINAVLKENTNYVLSFWMKMDDPEIKQMCLYRQKYFPTGYTPSNVSGYGTLILNNHSAYTVESTDEWQYVSMPFSVGEFHPDWDQPTSTIGIKPEIWSYNDDASASKTTATLWMDQISLREVPAESYTISCTESTTSVNDAGNLVITNTYDSKYISADNAKLVIDGTETSDIEVKTTQSLTQDKTTAVIEYTGELATGSHTIEVLMHDVWDKEVSNTLTDVEFVNYTANLFSHMSTCDTTSSFTTGIGNVYGTEFDTTTYHSAPASIYATKTNYSNIVQAATTQKLDLTRKYICTYWVKPESYGVQTNKWDNARSGVQTYFRYYNPTTKAYQQVVGVGTSFGADHDGWRKCSFIIDCPKNVAANSAITEEFSNLAILFTPYGGRDGLEQTIWLDDIELYALPEDTEMVTVCEETSYSQTADGGIDVVYSFNSANIVEANEYVTVDGTVQDAEITHSVVDGKTVVTVHFDKDAIAFGKHDITIADLTDIWGRTIASATANIYMLDHTKNLLEAIYECDDKSVLRSGSSDLAVVTTESYSGGSSAYTTGGNWGILVRNSSYLQTKNNTKYLYSFMIKTDGTLENIAVFRQYRDASGNIIANLNNAWIKLELTTDWQRVEFEYCDNIDPSLGVPETVDVFATAHALASGVKTAVYIDCIALRSLPEEDAMLSTMESASYKYGGAEFVFDTEYVNANAITVDDKETAATLKTVRNGGKTYITAIFDEDIATGTHTVSLSAEDLWLRSITADGTITADRTLAYVSDAAKSASEGNMTVTGKINTNAKSKSAISVVLIYNGSDLVNAAIDNVSLSADGSGIINETLSIGDCTVEDLTVKVMCWDSANGMIPYMNTYIVE